MNKKTRPTLLMLLGGLVACLVSSAVHGAPPTFKPLAYQDGDTALQAQVVLDPALKASVRF